MTCVRSVSAGIGFSLEQVGAGGRDVHPGVPDVFVAVAVQADEEVYAAVEVAGFAAALEGFFRGFAGFGARHRPERVVDLEALVATDAAVRAEVEGDDRAV